MTANENVVADKKSPMKKEEGEAKSAAALAPTGSEVK